MADQPPADSATCTQPLSNNTDLPDNKVHGANMGSSWGRQDPGGSHVGRMILAIGVEL